MTLADVRSADVARRFAAHPTNTPTISYGYTRSAFWLRLQVQNPGPQPIRRLLELGYAALSSVDVFQPGVDGTYETIATGSAHAFATRPYANHNFVFPVHLALGTSQVIYLRVQSPSSVLISARIWAPGPLLNTSAETMLCRLGISAWLPP
ncbi:MAG: hypothetical protein IPG34_16060 [Rhodocyclaceae bacterium]|nr:hypothetical protein [Rhodocyclaceae bacterium]